MNMTNKKKLKFDYAVMTFISKNNNTIFNRTIFGQILPLSLRKKKRRSFF